MRTHNTEIIDTILSNEKSEILRLEQLGCQK